MSDGRVYKLAPKQVGEGAAKAQSRLVRATSQPQAYGHLARATWTASVASQTDLIELLGQGVKVEDALEEEK